MIIDNLLYGFCMDFKEKEKELKDSIVNKGKGEAQE